MELPCSGREPALLAFPLRAGEQREGVSPCSRRDHSGRSPLRRSDHRARCTPWSSRPPRAEIP